MPSSNAARLRHLARVLRGEGAVTAAARKALQVLLAEAVKALAAAGYDTSVLDSRFPGWRTAVDKDLVPAIEAVFLEAWAATSRQGTIDPTKYATRYMEAVHNRLVGVSDEVFDAMRLQLEEGRQAQESIPQLAARVDALLADDQRWTNRAVTIARTEVVAANNAGAQDSAFSTADYLGVPHAQVARQWLATHDGRTRPSHVEADGQVRFGVEPYDVGGAQLLRPGDSSGPASEVVNCRCAELFYLPGDPNYPSGATPVTTVPEATLSAPALSLVPDTVPARVPVVEELATDSGPRSPLEQLARTLTLDELQTEARVGTGKGRSAARAELRRRGLAASGRVLMIPETLAYTDHRPQTAEDERFITDLIATMLEPITAAEEAPVTTTAPEPTEAPLAEPTHAGVAVQAADTGRILMQQRSYDPEDAPEVRGTWEFPGGGLEDGETPEAGAWREWVEETGLPIPEHETTGGWRSPDGVYQGFVATVPTEATVGPLNPHEGEEVNPDDPERENPDVAAWFTAEQIRDMGAAVRPEVLASTDWDQFAPTPADPTEEDPMEQETDPELEAALAFVRERGYAVGLSTYAPDEVTAPPLGERGPEEDVEPEEAEAPEDTPPPSAELEGEPFYGIIWPEGVESGDRRGIEVGATTWRDLPLPIMAQDAQAPGHDGAVRVGRLDTIERDETTYAVPVIRYTGVWDTNPTALETARQVANRVVRGISTDGDAVTVELRASDGSGLDPMVDDFPADGVIVEVATAARVSGGTVCSIPAFHQAYIANGTLADRTEPEPGWNEDGTPKDNVLVTPAAELAPTEPEAVMASAWSLVASAAPILQPADAFIRPAALDDHPDGTPFTVLEDGRVFGHLAVWGTCHIGIDGLCQEPPVSASNYAHFAKGCVYTDDGGKVATGPLVMDTGHAPLTLGARAAAAHYDNTGAAVADVVMGQDHIGIWFAGMIRPGTSPERIYAMRAAGAVSGDWRIFAGDLDLVAALVVNTPGFSIPRPALAASGEHGALAMVAAGMVRTPHPVETPSEAERVTALVMAALDRRDRVRAAQARLTPRLVSARRDRVAAAAARLLERV